MRRSGFLLFLLGSMALHGSSCQDPFEQERIPPPLIVRTITPADSVQLGSYDSFDLSITFNRILRLDEIRLEMFPDPLESGPLTTTGSGRNVTWYGIVPSPDHTVHRLLLDGRYMRRPRTLLLYTPGPIPRALFSGKVVSEDAGKVSPLGTVVFALELNSPFNPLEPESFNEIKAVQFDVVEGVDLRGDGLYAIASLVERSMYIVVAVRDTNGDAAYDPTDDWWGYYGNELANEPDTVFAYAPEPDPNDPEKPQPETRVDIKLRAPR